MKKKVCRSLMIGVLLLLFSAGSVAVAQETKPQYGGTLIRAAIYGDPEHLDPIRINAIRARMITMNLFDGLVKLDPEKGVVIPDIAERWEVSGDGKSYTFHLRKGVKFHNGREVKAADFKYSYDRVLDPKSTSPVAQWFSKVKGAQEVLDGKASSADGFQVIDDYTFRIELTEREVTFLYNLTHEFASVVPQEEVEKLGTAFTEKPVGSGPFKFESWIRDSEVVIVANPDYWAGPPYLDKVVYRIMKEAATTEAEFEAGNLDMFIIRDPQYRRFKDHPEYGPLLVEVPELWTRRIAFHNEKEPWTDKRVRQAFNYAIDRRTIIDNLLQGKAYYATGLFPPTLAAYNPDLKGYEYNPEKASQLLDEAGWKMGPDGVRYKNGQKFEFEIHTTNHPAWGLPAVEAVMNYVSKVGMKLKPILVEGAVVNQVAISGDYNMFIGSTGGDTHPLAYIYKRMHSKNFGGAGNVQRYKNPKVDELLDKAQATNNFDEMIALLREAEKIVVEDAPIWFYNYNKAVMARQPWVYNIKPVPTDMDLQEMEKVWIDQKMKEAMQ